MSGKILLVEDDVSVRRPVRRFLERSGFDVCEADTAASAPTVFRRERPDLVLLDYNLPDGDALEVLPRLKSMAPDIPVIILTGYGTIERAVQSVKGGADDFLTKPIELAELARILERALRHRRAGPPRERTAVDPFLGSSPAVRALAHDAHLAVRSDSPLLIQGETGSGKGILARWLHAHGKRSDAPFVTLNCGGLSKELLESELFGYARGAFTGAIRDKRGLLESADTGTLFLDEIGDMNPEVQPKLLTVLEEKTFRRLGEVKEQRVDLRLIAASNRDLGEMVREGAFRSDLYFRVSTIALPVPPLRERRGDLPELVGVILEDLCGSTPPEVTEEAVEALREYDWPGNFRELRSVLERALLACDGEPVERRHLRFDASLAAHEPEGPALPLAELERRHIEAALKAERGHVTRTAERLGIPRSTFYEKLKALEIEPSDYR